MFNFSTATKQHYKATCAFQVFILLDCGICLAARVHTHSYTHTHTHTHIKHLIHISNIHTHAYIAVRRTILPVVENYQDRDRDRDRDGATADLGPEENGSPDAEVMAEEYITIESYQADGPGQVSFKEGDKAHVLEKLEDGRWPWLD